LKGKEQKGKVGEGYTSPAGDSKSGSGGGKGRE